MINVLFRSISHYPVDRLKVINAIEDVLSQKLKRKVEVSLTVVGDRQMKQLNAHYRQKDYATDVLSFPTSDPTQPEKIHFYDPPDEILRLGDIVISYPQAVIEAGEENKLVDDKIIELALHGLDHLLGIHHEE